MGLGYLFCRTADSIADTDLYPQEERLPKLRQFGLLFDSFPVQIDRVRAFQEDGPAPLPSTPEGKLLSCFKESIALFNTLSRTDQALIQEVVAGVARGMEKDLTTFGDSADSLISFTLEGDLEDYLQWIGGEPGRFWSSVCLEHVPSLRIKDRSAWIDQGMAFGKGLQMVNILRDLPQDLRRGRCYIPEERLRQAGLTPNDLLANGKEEQFFWLYHQLIDETIARLRNGLAYLDGFPRWAFRLKAPVWWPLTIGLKTLRSLRANKEILKSNEGIKIKRREVYGLIGMSLVTLGSGRLLRWEFDDLSG